MHINHINIIFCIVTDDDAFTVFGMGDDGTGAETGFVAHGESYLMNLGCESSAFYDARLGG